LANYFTEANKLAEETYQTWMAESNAGLIRKGLAKMVKKRPLGSCHFLWCEKKKLLQEKHGVNWFTPAEMNPGMRFD
jgi:hypothetical protein